MLKNPRLAAKTAVMGLVLLALAVPSQAQMSGSTPPASADPTVAKINGQPVLRSEVTRSLQRMGPQLAQMPPQAVFPQVLDHVIATKVISAAGYAKGLESAADVKEQVKAVQDEIVAQTYVKQTVEPQVTDDKIKARYDELVKKFQPEDEVRARHILVKTEAEAKAVLKELKGGADFAKLATDKSKDAGSAKQGGDLGYFPQRDMVKEFADAAFALKAGQTSTKPVKTNFGYHIIKAEDRRKSSPPPLETVKQQVKGQLGQEMAQKLIQDMVKEAKVERFNADGSPIAVEALALQPEA